MPRELDDRWILELRGEKVLRASASPGRCILELTSGDSITKIRQAGVFEWTGGRDLSRMTLSARS